ncbi:hypothetical protein GCL60_16825 (plasmid) [Silvanigrella paludirubra]|uniref:Uncharacterized protein n=1 Tax=Silvanigrella paludirubra TaxID=2499159 RepID=A0A6N6VQ09_9BACT|nr:hypothetical protein [Silvanigrella paludirubra]KAB8035611.1 hypothetical protein GCL60_16825 [Silvanigrella paludirubra]
MIKKQLAIATLSVSVFFHFPVQSSGMPVVDIGSITQLLAIYQQITTQLQLVQNLSNDVDAWKRLNWMTYRKHLQELITQIDSSREISRNVNNSLNDFNKYFPGFNYKGDSDRINLSQEYMGRSSALLSLLSSQIQVANQAISNQEEQNLNSASLNSASQIAKSTLETLSQMNTLMASEMRAANSYRANQIQKENDDLTVINRFVGSKYNKKQDSTYKTWVGSK